jgi:hypothetical protein
MGKTKDLRAFEQGDTTWRMPMFKLPFIELLCSALTLSSLSRFIYETERHNGIAELLEILGRYVVL